MFLPIIDEEYPTINAPPIPSTPGLRVRRLRANERGAWNTFVAQNPAGHLLQSWDWGDFKADGGWQPQRIVVERADRPPGAAILAGAQVVFRRPVARIPVTAAYVSRGPVLDPTTDNPQVVGALWAGLHHVCRRQRAVFCRIEPKLEASPALSHAFAAAGFHPALPVQPLSTIVLDIGGTEEAILARMKPKTRYNIRLAGRRGVQIHTATGEADLRAFYRLMEITGERDEYTIRPYSYYENAWKRFATPQDALAPAMTLLLATHPAFPDTPLGALLIYAYGGEGIYMYGGSADVGREHMPNYLLQWEAIRWTRAQGGTSYDFWGIPDNPQEAAPDEAADNPNVRHGLWGIYRFKQGFGGRELTYTGGWDYVYNPLLYRVYQYAEAKRKAANSGGAASG